MTLARALVATLFALGVAQADAATKLTVSYGPAVAWIAAFVGVDQGIFAKHGLDVSLLFIPVGPNQPPALMAGAVQVAALNPTDLISADEGGMDIQIVAGAVDGYTGGVVARDGSGIEKPADFVGKTVAIPGVNGNGHVSFMKWLKVNGVDPAQARYIEVPINQMNDRLALGQVDAALAVEPFYSQILQRKTGYLVSVFWTEVGGPKPAPVSAFYTMRRSYIEANPAVLPEFRAAIAEATDWVAQHPQEARQSVVAHLKLPEQVAMTVTFPHYNPVVSREQMAWWLATCKEFGLSQGTVGIDDVLAK